MLSSVSRRIYVSSVKLGRWSNMQSRADPAHSSTNTLVASREAAAASARSGCGALMLLEPCGRRPVIQPGRHQPQIGLVARPASPAYQGRRLRPLRCAEAEHLATVVLAARPQTILWTRRPAKPSADCSIVAHGAAMASLLLWKLVGPERNSPSRCSCLATQLRILKPSTLRWDRRLLRWSSNGRLARVEQTSVSSPAPTGL